MLACRSVDPSHWFFVLVVSMLALSGCKAKIGDDCTTSTDCSVQGDRLCDISQPGGYCTVFNCEPGGCPEEAACVAFDSQVDANSACYDPSQRGRLERRFCLFVCDSNSDCRSGYICAAPAQLLTDYAATIAENDGNQKVCIRAPIPISSSDNQSVEVCQPPPFNLDVPYYTATNVPADSGTDADPDASDLDGGVDGDADLDASDSDASDGDASDATDATGN
jgi:hypothetical protein